MEAIIEQTLDISSARLALAAEQTVYMLFWALLLGSLIGILLGILLVLTREGGILENRAAFRVLNGLINIVRSVPFIILLVFIMPVTKAIAGTTIGTRAALVPLVFYIGPYLARLVESSLLEVDPGILEAAEAMGASTPQIVWHFLLPEALPSLILTITTGTIGLLGVTAMAGAIGAGGVGDLALTYGYQQFNTPLMTATVIVLILFVQLIQSVGNHFSKKIRTSVRGAVRRADGVRRAGGKHGRVLSGGLRAGAVRGGRVRGFLRQKSPEIRQIAGALHGPVRERDQTDPGKGRVPAAGGGFFRPAAERHGAEQRRDRLQRGATHRLRPEFQQGLSRRPHPGQPDPDRAGWHLLHEAQIAERNQKRSGHRRSERRGEHRQSLRAAAESRMDHAEEDGRPLHREAEGHHREQIHLSFVEMDSLNIPRSLGDFDYAVITGSIVYNAKIDPSTALLQEDILDHLILQVVVKAENKDAQWTKDLVAAYHSDEFKAYMKKNNKGLWFVPKELQ